MATIPVVYRVGSLVPSTVMQSGELRPEDLEQIPYPFGQSAVIPAGAWPPGGFTNASTEEDSMTAISSLLPEPYDLEWVQGDTAVFQFLFTDVFWTLNDPTIPDPDNLDFVPITDPEAPEWVKVYWNAQVRNPYIYSTYAADYWVPAYGYQYRWWRGHSTVAQFMVTSEAIEIPGSDPTQWATKVTMTLPAVNSSFILPGNWYRWDLQTRAWNDADPENPDTSEDAWLNDTVKTYLRGKVRVITEWTVA